MVTVKATKMERMLRRIEWHGIGTTAPVNGVGYRRLRYLVEDLRGKVC